MTGPKRTSGALACGALLLVVAAAFADSSIVVLALPDLLHRYRVSIFEVSWTITAYSLGVTGVALLLSRWRLRPALLAWIGALVFLASSIGCAIAQNIPELIALRAVQGAGAAAILVASWPAIRELAPARGAALWVGAGTVGAAVGPAIGGVLTQLLDWRAIFVVQAPFALFALLAARRRVAVVPPPVERPRRRALLADAALLGVSASTVGVLFLVVILLVAVWRFSPLKAAAVVTAIPVAAALAQYAAWRMRAAAPLTGAVLVAGGLASLALLPAVNAMWVVASLVVAGAGLGLLLPSLTEHSVESTPGGAARAIWLRHAGLVAGLLVLAPLLALDLGSATTAVKLRGIAVVLDAPVPLSTKLRLAVDLQPALHQPAAEGLPDFTRALASKHSPAITRIGHQLDDIVGATVTRGFRRTFFVAALFGLLAGLLPLLARSRLRSDRWGYILAAAAVVAALCASDLAAGAASFGEHPQLLAACQKHPPVPAVDGKTQRAFLSGLDTLACQLGETREELVLSVAKQGHSALKPLLDAIRGGGLSGLLGGLRGFLP